MPALSARASRRRRSLDAGSGLQHGRQLPVEHKLAGILGRDYAQLLVANGGSRGPKLRFGGRGDGRGHGGDPRLRPRALRQTGQFLGGPDARDALRAIAAVSARRVDPLSQGVLQKFDACRQIATLEGGRQTIALGPVASQEPIKLLSSDGGGFFNANSAHPFENPSPVANLFEMLLVLAIPASFSYTFGKAVNDRRQGWTLFAVMFMLFAAGSLISMASEQQGNPLLHRLGVEGGSMEGKEVRFGTAGSAVFSVVSTASSDGAVNSAHDSSTPLSELVQMLNMKTGEVIFGGTGSGILSMILMVLIAVFIAGLMVGRSPEYLGKRIEAKDIKMVMLALVVAAAANLIVSCGTFLVQFPAQSYWNPAGAPIANLGNAGPHGLSEILYANASAVGTNGALWPG